MKLSPPKKAKHTTLTFRVDEESIEALDGLLSRYHQQWPSERASMTRTWLVVELLKHGVEAATLELEARK
jgi:hypothetical protein